MQILLSWYYCQLQCDPCTTDKIIDLYVWNFLLCTLYAYDYTTSVARGGGGPAPPPPNNAFSEFCRYIWKSVGTCKPTSMSFVPFLNVFLNTFKI